jgi:hypothetical protein
MQAEIIPNKGSGAALAKLFRIQSPFAIYTYINIHSLAFCARHPNNAAPYDVGIEFSVLSTAAA